MATSKKIVRLQRLLFNSNDTWKPADWGDELVNLAYMIRAYEETKYVVVEPGLAEPRVTVTMTVREGGDTRERRYLCTLADLEEVT